MVKKKTKSSGDSTFSRDLSSQQEEESVPEILRLPDVLLLHIFSFLSVKEKCRAAKVCKTFRRLIKDRSLWRHIDLSSHVLSLRDLSKFARAYFSPSLQSLKICGFMWRAQKNSCLSNVFLQDIRSSAPNLSTFSILKADLKHLDSSFFPQNLQRIELHTCEITSGFLEGAIKVGALSQCKCIIMSHSSKFKDADVGLLSPLKMLKELILTDCYRLSDKAIFHLSKHHANLEKLWIGPGEFTDQTLHLIGRNMTQLKSLGLAGIEFFSGNNLGALKTLKKLEELDISYNHQFKNTSVISLIESLPKLKKIWVNDRDTLHLPFNQLQKGIEVL